MSVCISPHSGRGMALLWPKGVSILHVELSHVLESDLWSNVQVYGFTVRSKLIWQLRGPGGIHSATDLSTGCTLTQLITLSTKRSFTHTHHMILWWVLLLCSATAPKPIIMSDSLLVSLLVHYSVSLLVLNNSAQLLPIESCCWAPIINEWTNPAR